MPQPRTTKVFAVQDCQIAKMTADVTSAPTYGTLYDVPGIKKVGISFDITQVELRGDSKRLDSDSLVIGCKVMFDHAKLQFDVVSAMLGGAITESGTTPNQVLKYSRLGSHVTSYFKLEAKTPTGGVDTATGDLHILLPKLKIGKYDLGLAEEGYQYFSGEAMGSFTISDDRLIDMILNETAATIV